ncbi:SO2930 family diheme c-type cytochrome [Thalassolituus sp. LLYu03]|uniref:SO2930 family diheme c-type cytochrome n=1 Tax=Thalassolituus sp. LLYu03 TaxID=3421656 RepID=UPI003D2BD245
MNLRPSLSLLFAVPLSLALTACGGGGGGSGESTDNGNGNGSSVCVAGTTTVQWDKLLTENAAKLSDYQLFANPCDATDNPSPRGVPYTLSTPLFTDYASKYRFVFVPDDTTATYSADAAFSFPVGTVITKTFSLPSDTSERGFEHETQIETRLLIHRATGWVALPYVWNADHTDAALDLNGEQISTELTHKETTYALDYGVPDPQKCKRCHQSDGIFTPIGPKARFLNSEYDYGSGPENQLQHWLAAGILSGVPADAASIDEVPVFTDNTDISAIPPSQLQTYAKGWMDINCGHCHRPGGDASNTNFHAYWELDFDTNHNAHGVCQKPISYGGGTLSWIIYPGNADESIMIQRMSATEGGDRMPPLGRDLVHGEGVELVKAWINSLADNPACH